MITSRAPASAAWQRRPPVAPCTVFEAKGLESIGFLRRHNYDQALVSSTIVAIEGYEL